MIRTLLFTATLACATVAAATNARTETWGAIAIDNDGLYRSRWAHPTREEAGAVYELCVKNSERPKSCEYQVAGGKEWVAAVFCRNAKGRRGMARGGPTAKRAIVNAYKAQLNGSPFKKADCVLRALISADGSQLKYKQE